MGAVMKGTAMVIDCKNKNILFVRNEQLNNLDKVCRDLKKRHHWNDDLDRGE